MSDISKLIEALRVAQMQASGGTQQAAVQQFIPLDQPVVYENKPMPEGSSITAMSTGRVPQAGYVPVPVAATAEAKPAEGGHPANRPQEPAAKPAEQPAAKPAEKK